MARNRTWYTDMNVNVPDVSTAAIACKAILWTFKSLLKGITTGTHGPEGAPVAGSLWTVTGSSDGTTANFDNVDRTGDTFDQSKWVRGANHTTAHTWVCLKASDNKWMLLSYVGGANTTLSLYFATSAFSGGGIDSRPTSTTEWRVAENAWNTGTDQVQFTDGAAVPYRMHMTRDANGNFYWLLSKNSTACFQTFIGLVDVISGPAAEVVPHVSFTTYSTTGVPGNPSYNYWLGGTRNTANSGAKGAQALGYIYWANATAMRHIQSIDLDSDMHLWKMFICSSTVGSVDATVSFKGVLPDVHFSSALVTGSVVSSVLNGALAPRTGPYEMMFTCGSGQFGGGYWFPFSVQPFL